MVGALQKEIASRDFLDDSERTTDFFLCVERSNSSMNLTKIMFPFRELSLLIGHFFAPFLSRE